MFKNIAEKAFILIQADWPVAQAQELLDVLAADDVIVEVTGSEPRYYLLTRSAVEAALSEKDEAIPTSHALDLTSWEPTPVVHAFEDELDPAAPEAAVIVEDGDAIGFYRWAIPELDEDAWRLSSDDIGGGRGMVRRSVATRFPRQVTVGEIAPLTVYLTADVVFGSLVTELEVDTQLDVRVEALRRFEVEGSRKLSLYVRDEGGEPSLQFGLRATEEGLGVVCVYISVGAQTVGSITLETEIVAGPTQPNVARNLDPTVDQPLPELTVLAPDPDLCLTIARKWIDGETYLTFELTTREDYNGPQVKQPFEPTPLRQEPQAYFREFFKEVKGLKLSEAEWYFGWKGSELFQTLVPDGLRNVLWSLRDRIYSIQVLSRDPWIPWELCRLQGWENDELKDGPFLCEAFAVTRWLPKLNAKPALTLRNIAVIQPAGSNLAHATPERDYLLSLEEESDREVTQIPATRQGIFAAMQSGMYDAWHFVGHGEVDPHKPNRSLIRLESEQTLEPSMLTMGSVMNLGKARPLVFLNACQTGESISGLTGPAGWATRFLEAAWDQKHQDNGAAVFIGAYWPIRSDSAFVFAKAFYDELLRKNGGQTDTVGQAMLKARRAIKKENDPTWLAYTVFAHPLTTVQVP